MGQLILITEGGIHMGEYFINNKVYPSKIVLRTEAFQEICPYLNKEDEILIVIKGLTHFTMSEVYKLLDDIEAVKNNVGKITLVSNIYLGKVMGEYYLYTGDLFYGDYFLVRDGKIYNLDVDDTKNKKKKKKDVAYEEIITPIKAFYKYNKTDKVNLFGEKEKENKVIEEDISSKLIYMDLYDKSKKTKINGG